MAIEGKGRPTKAQREEKKLVNQYTNAISAYEREFKEWETRVEKILKRYRDDRSAKDTSGARFNILWSNVQTLIPATFSRLPQPDVSRRFRDNDPVGRVASLILERALDFEVQHYPDYRATLKQVVADRFLGGRGTAWIRYEPHIKSASNPEGDEVTEDVDEPEEELDYECAPIDYVHWKDYGHSIGRTWEEVTKVWRKVYMTKDACVKRFGELGNTIPLDSTPEDLKKESVEDANYQRALVYEIWDKERDCAVWLSKSLGKILDEKDDPLELEGFFPCPKPLYATLTNESLVPVPDFSLYQDQARLLDTLADRIDGLIKALQVKGVYDASIPELARLFTEGANTDLIPCKNWAAFAEKKGLQGSVELIDIQPLAAALKEAYLAFEQIKQQVYETTGIADIVRGETNPNETLGAQQLKGQYASLRLKDYQQGVALFATDALRLKAQVICGKFDPETITKISAVAQLTPADQQLIVPAMQLLLGDRAMNPDAEMKNPLRDFRIDIEADTLVLLDEQKEQQSRTEFLTAVGTYLQKALPVVQETPQAGGLILELMKFGVTGFKIGKTLEGTIDQALDQMRQAALQPQPPKIPPEVQVAQIKAQSEAQGKQAELQQAGQVRAQELQQEMQIESQRAQMEDQRAQVVAQAQAQLENQKLNHQAQLAMQEQQHEASLRDMELRTQREFDQWKEEFQGAVKIVVAEIAAKSALDTAAQSAEQAAGEKATQDLGGKEIVKPLADMHAKTMDMVKNVMQTISKPKKIVRDSQGRVAGVE